MDLGDEVFTNGRFNRRSFIRGSGALGLTVVGAGALAACADDDGAVGDKTGGTLRARVDADAKSFDPISVTILSEGLVGQSVFEPLVAYSDDGMANVLAKSFEVAPDGRSVDVTLKKGIKFHAGYGELTSEDVKFSLERAAGITKTGVDSLYASTWWGALKGVEVIDDHALKLVLRYPSASLLQSVLLQSSWAGIISKKAYEERGPKGFMKEPVGSGPYEFVSWNRETSIKLRRFKQWSGAYDFVDRPVWDRIEIVVIADDNAAELALEAGEITLTPIRGTSAKRFESDSRFQLSRLDGGSAFDFIGMNVSHPKLKDIRVRQALRIAFDIPAMIDAVYQGEAKPAFGPMPPGTIGYWEDAPKYERDVNQARDLLAQAAASNLQLTLTVPSVKGATTLAEIAQANLKDVGVKLDIDVLDPASFFVPGEENRSRQLFFTAGNFTTPTGDPSIILFPWFSCSQRDQWNWTYYCNAGYDKLGHESERELDPDRRAELVIEGQRLMDDAAFAVWVAYPGQVFASPAGVDPGPALGANSMQRVWATRKA
ncbi:MAG TPA: ABC transporter substrate-binding protein [Thermoleophilaceae bacterium]|nr:ABC transporter substrate-binding protein [Thermoleophilaceae bacterium]